MKYVFIYKEYTKNWQDQFAHHSADDHEFYLKGREVTPEIVKEFFQMVKKHVTRNDKTSVTLTFTYINDIRALQEIVDQLKQFDWGSHKVNWELDPNTTGEFLLQVIKNCHGKQINNLHLNFIPQQKISAIAGAICDLSNSGLQLHIANTVGYQLLIKVIKSLKRPCPITIINSSPTKLTDTKATASTYPSTNNSRRRSRERDDRHYTSKDHGRNRSNSPATSSTTSSSDAKSHRERDYKRDAKTNSKSAETTKMSASAAAAAPQTTPTPKPKISLKEIRLKTAAAAVAASTPVAPTLERTQAMHLLETINCPTAPTLLPTVPAILKPDVAMENDGGDEFDDDFYDSLITDTTEIVTTAATASMASQTAAAPTANPASVTSLGVLLRDSKQKGSAHIQTPILSAATHGVAAAAIPKPLPQTTQTITNKLN